MNPEIASSDSTEYTTDQVENTPVVEVDTTEPKLLLPAQSSASSSNAQWQEYGERIATFIQSLPTYVSNFFGSYKGPLGTIGAILLAVITLRLTLALLDAIDDIPLIAPTLELIGLGYTGWFIYRYLLSAASRKELAQEYENLKKQVLGTEQ